jgi:DNA-binding response OmpR family regulator
LLKKPESLPDLDDPDAKDMSLDDYLKYLDEEEANRKLIILAVDDSPVILKSVSSVLGNEYKVYTLPKPTMLEKLLTQITPELFLLDYKMPELSGCELIPIIRSFDEHKDTPIIFLTSEGTLENVTAALALGASDFVVKPFQVDVLRERIRSYIVRKKTF